MTMSMIVMLMVITSRQWWQTWPLVLTFLLSETLIIIQLIWPARSMGPFFVLFCTEPECSDAVLVDSSSVLPDSNNSALAFWWTAVPQRVLHRFFWCPGGQKSSSDVLKHLKQTIVWAKVWSKSTTAIWTSLIRIPYSLQINWYMIRLDFANSKFINRPENWRNYGISN